MELRSTFRAHWPEYFMEAAGLGSFMISACVFTALLQHPSSYIHQQLPSDFLRRALAGLAMASTNLAIIFSPWGKRSGAHLNPAVTLNFYLLGKIRAWDAVFYALFQFLGGACGVVIAAVALGPAIMHESVDYAITIPGQGGSLAAFIAELLISFVLMSTVLMVSNTPRLASFTPFFASTLVAIYITFESPVSGMSMNPARTFSSAFSAHQWVAIWIYFTAPPLGMILAGLVYRRLRGIHRVFCAKLHHHNPERCIFNCNFIAMAQQEETSTHV